MMTSYSSKRNCSNPLSRKGFSLVEVLIVITIIAVLSAIAFPIFAKVRKNGKIQKNKDIVTQLGVAIDRFYNEYGGLPEDASSDTTYSGESLVNILVELEGKADGLEFNTKGINFLDGLPAAKSGLAGLTRTNGTIDGLVNAFGSEVFVTLDLDYDEIIDEPKELGTREVKAKRSLVWTFGHDDPQADPEDILRDSSASWR